MDNLKTILALYDEGRYLDAYRLCRDIQDEPESHLAGLTADDLIHMGRLAGRLGGFDKQDLFYQKALEKDPEKPLVVYYARRSRDDLTLVEDITRFEENPDLDFGDPDVQSSWYAGNACMYAFVRDYEKAENLIGKARSFDCNHAWISACAAEILFRQDRWDDALKDAIQSFEIAPIMPSTSSILARVLAKKGSFDEINERLAPYVDTCQSFEFLMNAVWYICVKAERSDDLKRQALARNAYDLSLKLEELAPIADSGTLKRFDTFRMDIAMLMDDPDAMRRHGENTEFPFYKEILENVRSCPEGKRYLLPYRPVFQKHLTCLPTSIAAVLGVFGIHFDDDRLADDLTYDGTAIWRVEEWLKSNGYLARSFPAKPDLMKTLLENGLSFVVSNEYVGSSHATAMVGVDDRFGTFIVHDPSTERLVHVLINGFTEYEKPFGPMGLAIVPEDRRHLLDLIPEDCHEPVKTFHSFVKYMELNQPGNAVRILSEFMEKHPDHLFSERFTAIRMGHEGRIYEAIGIQKNILEKYPQCITVRRELLNNLHNTRNKSYIRDMLREIVTQGKIPGISKFREWEYPPTLYVAQYADFIGDNAEGYKEALDLLEQAMKRDPWTVETYHIFGDVLTRQGKYREAAVPFRIAAFLDEFNEHYAREACNACRESGKGKDGIDFLEKRVVRLHGRLHGSQAAITLIEALEDYGYPDQAIETMDRCLSGGGGDPQLAAYAVRFWVRMGNWTRAEEALNSVAASGHRMLYLTAAVSYYRMAGQWGKALEFAESWVSERPHNTEARRQYLDLYKKRYGLTSAFDLTRQWMHEFQDDEAFEGIFYEELKTLYKKDEQEMHIRKRIERNPYDIWAWHELGFLIMSRANLKSGDDRAGFQSEMDGVFERLGVIAPDHVVTHVMHGEYRSSLKDFKTAVDHYFAALEDDPAYSYCYSRIWDASATLPEDRQRDILARLEQIIFKSVGFLHHARDLVFNIAERFGAREAADIVSRWSNMKPEDPELIEARVDLLLYYGQGVSDARKAADILEPALERFPNHFDLRLSLARAYRILLEHEKENEALREIIRRSPLSSDPRNWLARNLSQAGKIEEAIQILKQGVTADPMDDQAWINLANLHWDFEQYREALDTLEQALRLLPEQITIRRIFSDRLLETGNDEKAVNVLKEGIEIYPDGSWLWHLYASALWRSHLRNDIHETERAFRKAIELNRLNFDAADCLSMVLTEQSRFGEARELMEAQIAAQDDPMASKGRMAWITRNEGRKKDALDEMTGVLKTWPAYPWAWSLLIAWLGEDEEYERARDLLADVHPVMADNPRFMADRLILLKKAGVTFEELNPQWNRLLGDFPKYERLHTLWIDQLVNDGRFEDADRILAGIERFYPESPYVMARRVVLHVKSERFDNAVDQALKVWTKPENDDVWPDMRVWDVIRDAGYMKPALVSMLALAEAGRRLRIKPFQYLIDHIEELDSRRPFIHSLIPFSWFYVPLSIIRLRTLLAMTDGNDTGNGDYQALILDRLMELGFRQDVLAYVKKNHDACLAKPAIWKNLGRMHVTGKRRDFLFVRKIMAEWREHPGVEMWAVTNYVICLRRFDGFPMIPEDLDELFRTTWDLITNAPHDHTVKYIVCVCGEAALRKNDDNTFLGLVDQFGHILSGNDERMWMKTDYAWVPDVLLMFESMIRETGEKNIVELTRKLRSYIAKIPSARSSGWVRKEWKKRAMTKLNWANRMKIRMALLR